MASISLCMIVKNEESVIDRCLSSIYDLMDEIIIVDTGSNDNTVQIAKKYTDKVYSYEWNNNFSDARNYSISLATCEYIYCADADEVLDNENRNKFKLLKEALLPEIEIVQMLYSGQYDNNTVYNYDEELRPKLFRRLRSFTFINPVHEILRLDPVVFDSDIKIFHKPHGNHSGRDLSIFANFYSGENALSISSQQLTMYAKELYISGSKDDFIKAIPVFEKAFETKTAPEDIVVITTILARAYKLSGNIPLFFKYAMKCTLSELQGCSEICVELGDYYQSVNDYNEAYLWYYNAQNECKPVLNIRYGTEIPEAKLKELG